MRALSKTHFILTTITHSLNLRKRRRLIFICIPDQDRQALKYEDQDQGRPQGRTHYSDFAPMYP
jgi:hypothetical protein